ncbi:MAG: hypothetical protein ACRDLN_05455 [Solirubrobacteraceae bacterium]
MRSAARHTPGDLPRAPLDEQQAQRAEQQRDEQDAGDGPVAGAVQPALTVALHGLQQRAVLGAEAVHDRLAALGVGGADPQAMLDAQPLQQRVGLALPSTGGARLADDPDVQGGLVPNATLDGPVLGFVSPGAK